MAWSHYEDGVLFIDKNEDGLLSDGSELFGDQTVLNNGELASDGYEALSELDTNSVGIIDSTDNDFSKLMVMKGT